LNQKLPNKTFSCHKNKNCPIFLGTKIQISQHLPSPSTPVFIFFSNASNVACTCGAGGGGTTAPASKSFSICSTCAGVDLLSSTTCRRKIEQQLVFDVEHFEENKKIHK
jgi:hypothetical protein